MRGAPYNGFWLSDAERATVGEVGHRLGRKVLGEVANVAACCVITIRRQRNGVPANGTQIETKSGKQCGYRNWIVFTNKMVAAAIIYPSASHGSDHCC